MNVAGKTKFLTLATLGAIGALAGVAPSMAQQLESAQKVDKIEVTGSNIKRADSETPSPVQTITRDDIQKSGTNSVAELLRNIPSISGGSMSDFNAGSGFARGTQSVSLRGLGSVGTLVLINGRRIEPSPVADPNAGQGAAFNLNVIPVTAIERIEILKDGASAIYGSDAVAGVVNVILRKDYTGGEVVYSGRQNHGSDFRSQTLSGAVGFGDPAKDRYNVLVAAEYFKRDPTTAYEASNLNTDFNTRVLNRLTPTSNAGYPPNLRREAVNGNGVFSVALPLDPRCPPALVVGTICRSNLFDNINIEAATERKSVFARGTIEFSPTLSGFGEFLFARAESQFIGAPPALDAAAPSTWFNAAGQRFSYTLFLPVGHPDNPNPFRLGLRYRFNDLGRTFQNVTNDSTRAVAGFNGNWKGWDWESGVLFSKTERTDRNNGQIYFPALQAAVANGTYRFFGANDPAVLASLNQYKKQEGESKNLNWDLKGSRELATMSGGPLMLAAGLDLRKEDFDIVSDPRNVAGEFIGVASSTVHGSRRVASVSGELSVPFAKTLEMQLAGRYDHYSDYGNSTTPKLGIKWAPINLLALRATYSEAFRAPSLLQISSGNVQAFNSGINDPLRCKKPGANPDDCNAGNGGPGRNISSLISANTNLKPERSKSYTAGFILSPTGNFSAAVDYFNIHRRDFVDRFDSQTVINNEFNANFRGGSVIRDPNPLTWLPGVPNSGPIQSTIRRFDNFGEAIVAGFDVDATANIGLGTLGKLKLTGQGTYLTKSESSQSKGGPIVNGLANFFAFEAPRVRGIASATWDYRDFSVLTRYNYTSKWFNGDPNIGCFSALGLTVTGNCDVAAFSTVDMGLTFTGFKDTTLTLLVRNIADKDAPFDSQQATLGFNPTFHSPQGVNFVLTAAYRFQ